MKVHNVRVGFATNSSSSHSIVMIPRGQREFTDEYHRFNYGWEQFTLADPESKSAYFVTQLMQALEDGHMEKSEIVHAVNSLLSTEYSVDDFSEYAVDHQSVWGNLGDMFRKHPTLVQHMHEFIKRDDVVILGGNDNSDGQTPPDNSYTDARTEAVNWGSDLKVRQDGDNWCMFSTHSGAKMRVSFLPDTPEYVKSTAPELVDLKISDYCAYGCAFCLVPGTMISTPTGVMPIEQISQGQEVLAYNTDLSIVESATVAETYERDYEGDLYEIEMENGAKVCITPEHEIYVKGKGWVPASLCEENDEILHIREAG